MTHCEMTTKEEGGGERLSQFYSATHLRSLQKDSGNKGNLLFQILSLESPLLQFSSYRFDCR